MNILLLHTNPFFQEIEDLIFDTKNNFHFNDFQIFEIKFTGLRWYHLSKLLKIRRFVKENKIDIIHTYNYADAYFAIKLSKFLKIKVIYSCYFNHDKLFKVYKQIFTYVLKNVDSIIFQTETHKNYIESKYKLKGKNNFKLLHGFSFDRFDKYNFESLRDEFFIDDFRYLIGTLGNFTPEHDVMNVFKMVRKLKKTGRNFTCVVSGEYIEEHDAYFNDCKYYYLVQGLDNYITYVGRRNNVANYLTQLDAFVYHSDNEAVALPVIQAMVAGVNVIVNDSEMIKEITGNGKYATLYKTNDATDFAEKTRNILLDLEDYKLIAETVKEECREIFSIKRHVHGLKEIYSKVNNF